MRKASAIFLVVSFCLANNSLLAQREKGEQMLTVGMGLSIWNMFSSVANFGDSIEASSTPTIYATYDYGITKQFSIGAHLSYNAFSFTNPYYSYVNSSGVIVYEPIKVRYGRTNIAVRPLYHWGKNEDFQWHGGMRLGYSFWTAEVESSDPYYTDEYYRQNAFSAQVLVGSRAYLGNFFYLTFDVGIGAPYFASLGLTLKL